MTPDTRLRQAERLKSRKQLGALFAEGQSFKVFPMRFVWKVSTKDSPYPARIAFGVSRKSWKRSVDRNLLKRRMREAYRRQKQLVYEVPLPADQQILISCLYTADVLCAFEQIHNAMTTGLTKLASQLAQTNK